MHHVLVLPGRFVLKVNEFIISYQKGISGFGQFKTEFKMKNDFIN